MDFVRTFHPVGQGAFYTERHLLENNKEFTVVYDCGSTSIAEPVLKKKIETTFCKGCDIDMLFISHFHKDHINGIKYLKNHCNIKRVVMPYINIATKILSLIPDRTNGEYDFELASLLDNPKSFFKAGTEITQIEGFSDNKEQNDPPTIEIPDGKEMPSNTPSGTKFIVKSHFWYYIPYNFNAETKGKEFLKKLDERGVKIKEEDNTIKIIDEYWSEIKQAYKDTFKKKINESSMVLFSGKKEKDDKKNAITCTPTHTCIYKYIDNGYYLASKEIEVSSGCLYTGDVNLNGIVGNIKKELDVFYKNIGTLQIPHHGSIFNFDRSILDGSSIKYAIISYGAENNYGHPSAKVIEELRVKRVYDHHVTGCLSSMVIQVKNEESKKQS
jgi:metal-dependent hydrolase (beta-lactamase superfamily II)